MSHIPETTDLEAQIADLIKRAGDSLRQHRDEACRNAAGRGRDDAPRNDVGVVAPRLEGAR
jgi:hypothetical protein